MTDSVWVLESRDTEPGSKFWWQVIAVYADEVTAEAAHDAMPSDSFDYRVSRWPVTQ